MISRTVEASLNAAASLGKEHYSAFQLIYLTVEDQNHELCWVPWQLPLRH